MNASYLLVKELFHFLFPISSLFSNFADIILDLKIKNELESCNLSNHYLTYYVDNWKLNNALFLQVRLCKSSYIIIRILVLYTNYWHWLVIGIVTESLSLKGIYFHLNGTKKNLCREYITHLHGEEVELMILASFKEMIKRDNVLLPLIISVSRLMHRSIGKLH